MSARSSMTMRATVSRKADGATNDWGTPGAPTFTEQTGSGHPVPCRAWSKQRRDVTDEGKQIVIEDMRATTPVNADIQEGDQLVIKDRKGTVLFAGPVAVESIARSGGPGTAASHLLLMLTRHV